MAGLDLRLGAGAQASAGPTSTGSGPMPRTASEAAWGPAGMSAPPTTGAALAPNDAFGMAFWAGIAALGLLLFIRYSLPA